MAKKTTQPTLDLPETGDGRKPSGMKTAIAGAGNRISKPHPLGSTVYVLIEAKVKGAGHEETDDGVLYVEKLKTVDLFELEDKPGKRLLSALRQQYRTDGGEPVLSLGDETAGEGIEGALDASGVAITPAELADLRDDPAGALTDERLDNVVLVFADGSRGLWPDDWAGTGQSRAVIGGTMRRPGSQKPGDVDQVVELLDATTGETIDLWTPEREAERLLALEGELADEEDREEFEALRAKEAAATLNGPEAIRLGELRERFEAEARADREVHDAITGDRGPVDGDDAPADQVDPPEANEDLVADGEPDPDAPFVDPPDPEVEDDEPDPRHVPGPDDFALVDQKVGDVIAVGKELTDRNDVLRLIAAEEAGRGRGLKPRAGVLEGLEKRAGELFGGMDQVPVPDLPTGDGFDVPDDADPADFGPGADEDLG